MEEMKYYRNDICSIDQMKELGEMGFDLSDSSCVWTSIQDEDHNPVSWLPVFRGEERLDIDVLREKFPLTYREGNVYYCYTFSDLFMKLPMLDGYFPPRVGKVRFGADYVCEYEVFDPLNDGLESIVVYGESMIDCVMEMLRELKGRGILHK